MELSGKGMEKVELWQGRESVVPSWSNYSKFGMTGTRQMYHVQASFSLRLALLTAWNLRLSLISS